MYPLRITHYAILTSFLFLLSCQNTPQIPTQTSLLIYRFDPPAFLEYDGNFQPTGEIPFSIPPNCGLFDAFPAPIGPFLLIELSCPNGQTVLFLDAETVSVSQPISRTDAHFLAWTSDGESAYLKINSLGSPQVIRAHTDGEQDVLEIPEFTYDLSAKPGSQDFTFTFSRGLGYGSELHLAQYEGRNTRQLYTDPYNYISFARFSPDGSQIAFIKIPDTQTPFTVGELWVMDSDGANALKLADADAGHGYAANWSPDGTRIAFVVRENPGDENANQSSEALISNIYLVEVETGGLTQITRFGNGHAETPHWSPDGNTLVFNAVIDGRMTVFLANVDSVGAGSSSPAIEPLVTGSACCPAWMRK